METLNFDTVHFILVFIKWAVYDSRSSVYGCVVFMARVMLDQFRFLGNCLPTPPLAHVNALKSHVSDKHWLGVGWMCSFENVFLVFLFLFNILNLVLLFYRKFSGPFSLAPNLLVNSWITFWERGILKHMLLSDFYMGKNDTFWAYLKHRMLGYLILRYLSASRV